MHPQCARMVRQAKQFTNASQRRHTRVYVAPICKTKQPRFDSIHLPHGDIRSVRLSQALHASPREPRQRCLMYIRRASQRCCFSPYRRSQHWCMYGTSASCNRDASGPCVSSSAASHESMVIQPGGPSVGLQWYHNMTLSSIAWKTKRAASCKQRSDECILVRAWLRLAVGPGRQSRLMHAKD